MRIFPGYVSNTFTVTALMRIALLLFIQHSRAECGATRSFASIRAEKRTAFLNEVGAPHNSAQKMIRFASQKRRWTGFDPVHKRAFSRMFTGSLGTFAKKRDRPGLVAIPVRATT
jgi:hypothetical protein